MMKKPINKIKPKFHEGDRIIHQGTKNIYQVVAVIDNQYQLKYGDNYTIQNCADVDKCARLLKKFEQEPTKWSKKDDEAFNCALDMIEWYDGKNREKTRLISNWLKSIKDRIQQQTILKHR